MREYHMASATESLKQPRPTESAAAKASQGEREMLECGGLSLDAVLTRLGATEKGLSPAQVQERLERYGPNEVEKSHKQGFIGEIFQRCKNPLVIQLLVIAGVSLWMDDVRSAVVVGGMVVLSVMLGYVQEKRSSKAVERLLSMI